MRINPSISQLQQAEQANRVREGGVQPTSSSTAAASPVAPAPKVDRVEISDAGRALSAQQGADQPGVRAELSPERLTELRSKVLGGAYNSLEMVDQIARRMLQSGDI